MTSLKVQITMKMALILCCVVSGVVVKTEKAEKCETGLQEWLVHMPEDIRSAVGGTVLDPIVNLVQVDV